MTTGTASSADYARIVKQAWVDPQFKARLVADPVASLAAAGVSVPAGVTVKLVEDTDKLIHFVLPVRPSATDLDAEALDLVVGGIRRTVATYTCAGRM